MTFVEWLTLADVAYPWGLNMRCFRCAALAAVALVGFASVASAADLPTKAPVYNAPPMVTSSWTGAYAGIALGYKWSSDDWNTPCLGRIPDQCSPSLVSLLPALTLDASNPHRFDPSGIRAGGYIGYNWQVAPRWVIGLEGDLAWADNSQRVAGIVGCATGCFGFPTPTGGDSSSLRVMWDASLRGRIGFLATPDVLTYATGGVAAQAVEANVTCVAGGPWCGTTASETYSKTLPGWTVGGGAEWKLQSNWLARVEYRYSEFEHFTPHFFASFGEDVFADIHVRTQIVTFGLAYLFNGSAPIGTKY